MIVSNTFIYQINPSKKTGETKRKELAERCKAAAKKALEPLTDGKQDLKRGRIHYLGRDPTQKNVSGPINRAGFT